MGKNNGLWRLTMMAAGLILSFCGCRHSSTSSQAVMPSFLPESGQVEGWQRERALLHYVGEDLFEYINGGADIYHEYGFRKVVVQYLQDEQGHSLSAEIYEMENPEAAYGIYTFKKSPAGSDLNVAVEGRIEDYYLNFWKDRYLVTLTGFDQEEETVEGLRHFAREIADRIPMPMEEKKPSLILLLPARGFIAGSEKYFKGNLGLYNSYPFSRQNIFGLGQGVKESYEQGYDIYIFSYEDRASSRERYSQVNEFFRSDPKFHGFESLADSSYIYDDRNTLLYFQAVDDKLIVILGAETPSIAEKAAASVNPQF